MKMEDMEMVQFILKIAMVCLGVLLIVLLFGVFNA